MRSIIAQDYLEARKGNDVLKKNLLGTIIGEFQTEELRGNKEVDVDGILRKMEKALKQVNTEESLKELEILKKYLPSLMTEDEIEIVLLNYKRDEGITKLPEFMSLFNRDFKGKADNKVVIDVIKKII